MTDSTSPIEAVKLAQSFEATVAGRKLTAIVEQRGTRYEAIEAGNRWQWVEVPAYHIVFEGGVWGAHELPLEVSSPKRIQAHWDGYVEMHRQRLEAKPAPVEHTIPAGLTYAPFTWTAAPGVRCLFQRGMFGWWAGTIERVYKARGGIGLSKGTALVDIRCKGANGKVYNYKRVPASTLRVNGVAPREVP